MTFRERLEEAEQAALITVKDSERKTVNSAASERQPEFSTEWIDSVFSGMKHLVRDGLVESMISALCEADAGMEWSAMEEYHKSGFSS
jgi:hypothetical protein